MQKEPPRMVTMRKSQKRLKISVLLTVSMGGVMTESLMKASKDFSSANNLSLLLKVNDYD
jgi:hypothetical protein